MGMSKASKEKKLVGVRVDLLSQIIKIANREGKTITTFVNEVLEQAVKAYEMRLSLQDVVNLYMLTKISREGGGSVIPREILKYLISKVYQSDRDALMSMFHKAGTWFGKYIIARVRDREPVEFLQHLLYTNIWDTREVYVDRLDGRLSVRCIAPQLSIEETELLASYIEGLVNSLGFKLVKNEAIRGIIILEFERESEGIQGEEAAPMQESSKGGH